MTETTVLFLPTGDSPWRWLRVGDDGATERGEGLPAAARIVAVAPAEAIALHWADLPDRSTAQSIAAARILIGEASAAPLADLHVAVGREDGNSERPIAVVTGERMRAWLATLATHAIDPAAMYPAAMLLPRVENGFVRGEIGDEAVVRGPTSGFADEARLTELVTGGVVPEILGREAVDAAIVAAIAAPALDLRQGPFARRRRRALDWTLIRRLAVLGGAILAVTLMIDLVRIAKYSFGADAIEARADAVARTGLRRGETGGDPARLLSERLARLRGPGLGFSRTAAVVLGAVRDTTGTEVTALTFDPNGDLRVTLGTDGEAQANAVKAKIEAAGFVVTASAFAASGTRLSGEFTVRTP